MKSIISFLFLATILAFPIVGAAQVITNVNTSSQNCQCDTINVTFAVTAPLNVGNEFKIQLSDNLGQFPGTNIEINPLLGFNVGNYNMDAVVPCNTPQGVYKIRVVGSNPVIASDTLSNIIIGRNPNTDITIYGTYTYANEQRFCDGDTAILVGAAPPLGETHQYQWFNGGSPLTNEINDTLIVTTSGSYSVRVTLGLCDALSKDTIVNAYTPPSGIFHTPDPSIVVITPTSIRMCEGTTAFLNGPTPVQPGIEYKYQWLTDSIDPFGNPVYKPLAGDTLSTLQTDTAGVFYLSVLEVNGGCVDTNKVGYLVFVDTIPQTSIVNVPWPGQSIPSLSLCFEDSTMLTVADTVFWPQWQHQWQVSYPPGSPWIDIPGDTNFYLQVDTSLIADTADYRCITRNQTCTFATNSLQVLFVNDPIFQFFPSDSVATCAGDSVLVQIIGNGLNYTWSDGYIGSNRWMKAAGDYGVVATGINGCTSTDTLKVGIYVVTANAGSDQTIAPGESAQLNGSGGVSYFWFADKPSYFNNQFISNPLTQPTSDTTLYFVQVTGPNGCTALDSVYVFVVDTAVDPGLYANIQNLITPNSDGHNDFLNIPELLGDDACQLIVLNRWGEEVYSIFPYMNQWNGISTGGDELPDGTYYYMVKFEDKIRYKGPVTIIRNSK